MDLEFAVGEHDITRRSWKLKDHEKFAIGTGTASSGIPVLECSKLASKRSTGKPF